METVVIKRWGPEYCSRVAIPSFSTVFKLRRLFGEANVAARLAEGLVGVDKHRFLMVYSIIAVINHKWE